jgi:polysaccharide deacetylase family protein (PEP-CTERM system associated)
VDAILSLLNEHGAKGTFFVVGRLAQTAGDILKKIVREGHEIAAHGYMHNRLHAPLRQHLPQDLERAKGELESVAGQPVIGFRAPEFSVPPAEGEVFFDLLAEAGYRYDSSIVPIQCARYGLAGFDCRPRPVPTAGGGSIMEFPLSVVQWLRRQWLVAGGGYWRVLPSWVLRRAAARVCADGRPFVTYIHTYDFERLPLRVPAPVRRTTTVRKWEMRMNLGRRSVPRKLACMLRRFRFAPLGQLLEQYEARQAQPQEVS